MSIVTLQDSEIDMTSMSGGFAPLVVPVGAVIVFGARAAAPYVARGIGWAAGAALGFYGATREEIWSE